MSIGIKIKFQIQVAKLSLIVQSMNLQEITSECDQEIPQSHTTDQPMAP